MKKRRVLPLVLSTVMLSSLAPVQVFASQNEIPDQFEKMYSITSPYEQVDWVGRQ